MSFEADLRSALERAKSAVSVSGSLRDALIAVSKAVEQGDLQTRRKAMDRALRLMEQVHLQVRQCADLWPYDPTQEEEVIRRDLPDAIIQEISNSGRSAYRYAGLQVWSFPD